MKKLWDWLRNGLEARRNANQVQVELLRLRRLTVELQLEWSEVLDKLMAREDRQRKRDRQRQREIEMDEDGLGDIEGLTPFTANGGKGASSPRFLGDE